MKISNAVRRFGYSASAILMAAATLFPSLMGATAHAFPTGGQVTSRSIKMSSSKVSDTAVTYHVQFNSFSGFNVKGIIVAFCSNSPIIGDSTCTKPAVFDMGVAPTVSGFSASVNTGTWTKTGLNGGAGLYNVLKLTNPSALNTLSNGTTVSFDITSVTNTSALGTFYGRIIDYSSDTGDISTYAAGTEGSVDAKDYGGVALATANVLNITAKVQESLVFCVYLSGATCAGAGAPPTNVALGDANGVLSNYATPYLSTTLPAASQPHFNIASNASGGVIVNMKGENLCRVASPCTNTDTGNIIDPSGVACTADSVTTSVEQFGVRVSTLGTGVLSANYGCASGNHNFNRANIVGTYGDTIANMTGPSDEVQSVLEFEAKAATTTQAGIYTTNLGFIATGTY